MKCSRRDIQYSHVVCFNGLYTENEQSRTNHFFFVLFHAGESDFYSNRCITIYPYVNIDTQFKNDLQSMGVNSILMFCNV